MCDVFAPPILGSSGGGEVMRGHSNWHHIRIRRDLGGGNAGLNDDMIEMNRRIAIS